MFLQEKVLGIIIRNSQYSSYQSYAFGMEINIVRMNGRKFKMFNLAIKYIYVSEFLMGFFIFFS